MSVNRLHLVFTVGWIGAVLASFSLRVAFGGLPGLTAEYFVWCFVGCAPAVFLLSLLRSSPPRTIAQVLYDVEHLSTDIPAAETSRGSRYAPRQ